jgi:hypothetical protein
MLESRSRPLLLVLAIEARLKRPAGRFAARGRSGSSLQVQRLPRR